MPSGWSIEKLLVAPFGSSGHADVLFTAVDSSGNTKREVLHSTDSSATQRDISALTPTDVQLADEAGEQIIAILPVDANQDGATDYIYAYENGRTKLVLAQVAARTDLANLSMRVTTISSPSRAKSKRF